jgi:hypothetical protein
MGFPVSLLRKLQKIRNMRDGGSGGEVAAAKSAIEGLEKKYPGLGAALDGLEKEATADAKRERVRKAGFQVPDPSEIAGDSWVSRLVGAMVERAVSWSVDRLSKELGSINVDLEEFMAKKATKPRGKRKEVSFEDRLLKWSNKGGIEELEVDPEWEDDDKAELYVSMAIPKKLWVEIVEEPAKFIAFLSEFVQFDSDEEEEEDEDFDEDEEDFEDDFEDEDE